MKKNSIIIILIILSFGCKKNRFNVKDFLPNLYELKIEPEIESVESQTQLLVEKWEEMNNDNIKLFDIESFRSTYQLFLADAFGVLMYNFGEISKIYVYNRFYKANIDTADIWESYFDTTVFFSEGIQALNNKTKGTAAIEYLLNNSMANDSILNSSKYRDYMGWQLGALKLETTNIKFSWSVYQTNFETMTDEGVGGSYNILVNRMIHILEDIVVKKIGTPLINPEYYEQSRLTFIKSSIEEAFKVYMGEGEEMFNSIYNHTRKKDKKVANLVKDSFEELIIFGNNLQNDYAFYFESDQGALKIYLEKIKAVIIRFKLDVPPLIGISLTFGEIDGD